MRRLLLLGPLVVILLAAIALGAGYFYVTDRYESAGPLSETRSVVLARGGGARAIAAQLAKEGVIENERFFLLGLWLGGEGGALKAGEYEFPSGISAEGVVAKLSKGETVIRRMTFAEGLTSAEIVAQLEASSSFTGEITVAAEEGALLPETYHYG